MLFSHSVMSTSLRPQRVPSPSPGDLPDPGPQPESLALAGRFFTAEPVGKPKSTMLFFSPPVVSDSATPCTAACQASLPFTISRSLLKLMSVESVMPSNHLILYRPLMLLLGRQSLVQVFVHCEVARRGVWGEGPTGWYWSHSLTQFLQVTAPASLESRLSSAWGHISFLYFLQPSGNTPHPLTHYTPVLLFIVTTEKIKP